MITQLAILAIGIALFLGNQQVYANTGPGQQQQANGNGGLLTNILPTDTGNTGLKHGLDTLYNRLRDYGGYVYHHHQLGGLESGGGVLYKLLHHHHFMGRLFGNKHFDGAMPGR